MLTVKDLDLKGKSVFLRVDFNVPLDEKGTIRDDTRIKATLPTIQYLKDQRAKIIAASHLGRPKGKYVPELSLKPVAERLSELISDHIVLAPEVIGKDAENLKQNLGEGKILLLENLRFHKEETDNNDTFAKALGSGIDYFVNDAFGACHRAHASVVAIARHVKKSAAGFLVAKETECLKQIILNPKKPYVAILGGAKVSDKIPVMDNLLKKADAVLIGGAMAYTFFHAQGFNTGRSLIERDMRNTALKLMNQAKEQGVHLMLPPDHIAAEAIEASARTELIVSFPIPANLMALDIGPQTVRQYSEVISRAKTVFWNGPMGVFELDAFSHGTTQVARAVAHSDAFSIVGGGDSVAALYKAGVENDISHISTGGGASLEFIAHETLPGLEALTEK